MKSTRSEAHTIPIHTRYIVVVIHILSAQEMEAAYIIDFYLAYESEMKLSSIHTKTYSPNEVSNSSINSFQL